MILEIFLLDKTHKKITYDKDLFYGQKIKDIIEGDKFFEESFLKGKRFQITGASSITGTPYSEMPFFGKKKLLLGALKKKYFLTSTKGLRKKKLVFGNILDKEVKQINLKEYA